MKPSPWINVVGTGAVVFAAATSLHANDWPQFRGPTGDGIALATNLPLTWSPTQNVAWKVPVPGRGRSSPVILGDRIWLTTAHESGVKTFPEGPDKMQQAERVVIGVVCLDRATGKQLFHVELFALDHPVAVNLLNSYATPTPVAEPGRLYCDFGTFGTACLDATTGQVLWKRQLPVDHHHGPGSSPVVYKNLLILVRDGRDQQYVTALNKQTGETVWKSDRPPLRTPIKEFRKSFSTPLIFEAAGRVQMVVPGAQWLVAYEPEAGQETWRVDDGKGETVAPRPVYGQGMVFLSTGILGSRPQLWAVRVDGQGDVTQTHVAWKLPTNLGFMPSPLLVGRELYLLNDDGFVSCLDAQSGAILGKARATGNYAASPVFAGGRIYCFSREGKTAVFQANKDLNLLAENQLDGPVFASPALVDSAIYVRTDSHLYCLSTEPVRPSASASSGEKDSGGWLEQWTLQTADTTLGIGVRSDHALCLRELRSSAGWNWTATPSPFPLVGRADMGGTQHSLHWRFQNGTLDKTEGTKITLTFTNEAPPLELSSVWQARRGPGPVRHAMVIKNRAPSKVTIYEQESLEVRVIGPGNETSVCYVNDDGSLPDATGVYHDRLVAGYQKTLRFSEDQDFIPLAMVDAPARQGVYVGWEWSIGRMTIGAHHAPSGASLRAGNGDSFKTDVEPGETFAVPAAFIGAYQGSLDDAGNSLRKYLFNYSMPSILKNDPAYPKVEWNAFAATGKGQGSWDSTETKYRPLINDIAPLGFEEVVLDIGWWPGDATHKPHPPANDPVDWPSGMRAVRDYAHDKGMRFGLYWNCNPPMTTVAGLQHRQEDAHYLYNQFHIDFFRSDGTDGNVLQTGGHGAGTRAHYAEDVGYWQTKGYYEVLDALYAEIPNFSYENCSGGGRIKDYGILKRCLKIQSQDRYYPLDARRSFYDSSHALHPMQIAALCGSWAEWQAAGSVYEFRSASMGAAYWHPDAPNGANGGPVWNTSQRVLITQAVNTYKTWLRPLIRTANLYHIFPRPDDKVWDGIEYYDPGTGKGAVYVFRPNSPVDTQTIRFQGLAASATYWLWGEDGSIAPVQQTGSDLMQTGLAIRLAQPFTSDLIFIQDASQGRPAGLEAPGEFGLNPAETTSQLLTVSAQLSWEASRHARQYRVTVGETPDLARVIAHETTTVPAAVMSRLPPLRKLYWKVEALSPGGSQVNRGSSGSFTTPDRLAKEIAFASDMQWVRANAGANNPVRRDKNLHEDTLKMNGKMVEKGLWTHSFNDNTPADIVFDVSGRDFAFFKASAGLEDLGERGSVQFLVLVDGQKKAETPIMRPKQIHELVVDIRGAKEIALRVLNGGDGFAYDHAVWGSARFLKAGTLDPL